AGSLLSRGNRPCRSPTSSAATRVSNSPAPRSSRGASRRARKRAPGPGARRLHRGPPWLRTVAVDPETLEPLDPGELGVLRHFDLANLHSVMALQTADLGRVSAEGVELLGRATGAEARGCSIAMDELLAVMQE
ncbi:MAG: hypothetical protein WD766_13290, partial [Gemmatimonadota bacterium]